MKLVAQILATYNDIDGFLFQKFDEALNAGDQTAQQAISEKRVLTDNAFFVLLWGQLENEINDRVGAMINNGKSDPSFEKRRLYYNLDPDRMKFEDRLALVADKNAGSGSAWSKAITYYGLTRLIHRRSGLEVASVA